MSKKKPRHLEKLTIEVVVECTDDLPADRKCVMLLQWARTYDKHFSKKVEKVSVKQVISGDKSCIIN